MVSMDGIVRRGHPIVFGLLVLFSILSMCISAWVTAQYNSHDNAPNASTRDRVRYVLFLSVWTIVFGSAYLVIFLMAAGSMMMSVLSHLIFLGLTWVLWLAAAAAVTQTLGGAINCQTQDFFVYCGQLNAIQGFAWINWIVVTFLLVFVLIRGIASAKRGDGYAGGLVA